MIEQYLHSYNIELTDDSGEEIERSKNIVYSHTGIIVGKHRSSGMKMIFHNHEISGPSIVTLDDFSKGLKWTYTKRIRHERDKVLLRTFEQLEKSKPYHTFFYNCQHATCYSRLGKHYSTGVFNTASVMSVLFLISAITSRTRK